MPLSSTTFELSVSQTGLGDASLSLIWMNEIDIESPIYCLTYPGLVVALFASEHYS